MNAAACLVFSARRLEHTTPLLRELHWMQVPERIQFRLCVLVYRCLNGTAPPYLAETLRQSTDVDARRRLQSAAMSTLIETHHTWQPHLPGCGCTPLERLAIFYPGCIIIAAVLLGTEDSAVFIVI